MLTQMRQFSKSWISSLFLGVLSLSFVAWGIGDIFHGSSSTAVATIGGSTIEQEEFKRDYDNYLKRLGEQRGKPVAPEEARRANLGPQLLQQNIARMALDNVVNQLGLTVSDDMVSTMIRSIPSFAGLTGTFDRNTFLQAISKNNYSEKGFIELVRRDLAREQLVHAAEAGFAIPTGYARALFAYSTEVRAADYVTVSAKALSAIAPPADSVLAAYVKSHADKFSTPEYRDVSYAEVGPDDVAKSITVTDAQIASAYEQQKDQYVIPEKRDLEQISFPTQAEADAASAKLRAGQTFDQIAFARGMKLSELPIGTVAAADLDPAQAKAAFALPQDGVTAPIKGAFGYIMLHVVKITPGKTTTLDQAKEELRKKLLQELAQSKLADIANAYTDAVSGGANVAEAAKKVGIRSGHAVAMDSNGLAPDGSKAAAPDDPDFRAQAFRAEVGEDGDLVPAKSGHYYVVMVNGVVPPKLKPLDAVRAPALAAWIEEQRGLLLSKKAEELASLANKGQSLDDIAKTIGATVQSSPALTRQAADATFSPELVNKIFAVPARGAVFGPMGSGGDFIVARVTGILHPVPPTNDPRFRAGVRSISGGVGSDITESLAYSAREKQGVKINQKILTDVTGEGS